MTDRPPSRAWTKPADWIDATTTATSANTRRRDDPARLRSTTPRDATIAAMARPPSRSAAKSTTNAVAEGFVVDRRRSSKAPAIAASIRPTTSSPRSRRRPARQAQQQGGSDGYSRGGVNTRVPRKCPLRPRGRLRPCGHAGRGEQYRDHWSRFLGNSLPENGLNPTRCLARGPSSKARVSRIGATAEKYVGVLLLRFA